MGTVERMSRVAPPNILLLCTDQQRADTIAALGNRTIRTPVLDGLVGSATSFERAYAASPVCVPSRHAMVTGLAPHRSGVVDNVAGAPDTRSFMELLAEAGYQTHGTGKMHFCGDPRRAWGFASRDYSEELDADDDYRAFLREAGYGHVLDPLGFRSEYYYLPQPSQLPAHLHHTAWVADRSIDFLRRRDRRRPFLLWSSFIKPHPPFETPNPWSRLYRSAEMEDPLPGNGGGLCFWNRVQNRFKYMDGGINPHLLRTQRAAYYASISFIDHHVGRILGELGSELDETLVVFTSDHGEMLGDFGCFGKRCMMEASVRVPLIARHPARFPAGRRCGTPVSLLDLYPTFSAATGCDAEPPDPGARPLDQLAAAPDTRRIVTSQFSQRSLGLYMATDGEWKYVHSAADRRDWLHHLTTDPHERDDRSDDPSARSVRDVLRGALIDRFERDGYAFAVEDGRWRDYGTVTLPPDPRDGLLLQDPPELARGLGALADGYARRAPALPPDWYVATQPSAMNAAGRLAWPDAGPPADR